MVWSWNLKTVNAVDTHIDQTSKEKFKQTLCGRQKADDSSSLGQERSADGGIRAKGTTIKSEADLETEKTAQGLSKQKVWNDDIGCTRSAPPPLRARIQLLTLEYCYRISTGSCLTTFLTDLISLRVQITALQQ
jgi:hypothetical protein